METNFVLLMENKRDYDLPAVIYLDGNQQWFKNGFRYITTLLILFSYSFISVCISLI